MRCPTATTAGPRAGRAGASGRGGARQAQWITVCGGGVRQVVMDRGVRRRDGPRVAAGRGAAARRTRVSLRVSPGYGSGAPRGKLGRAAARTVRCCIAVRNAGGMAKAARTVERIAAQKAMAVIWRARRSGMFIRCRPSAVLRGVTRCLPRDLPRDLPCVICPAPPRPAP